MVGASEGFGRVYKRYTYNNEYLIGVLHSLDLYLHYRRSLGSAVKNGTDYYLFHSLFQQRYARSLARFMVHVYDPQTPGRILQRRVTSSFLVFLPRLSLG